MQLSFGMARSLSDQCPFLGHMTCLAFHSTSASLVSAARLSLILSRHFFCHSSKFGRNMHPILFLAPTHTSPVLGDLVQSLLGGHVTSVAILNN